MVYYGIFPRFRTCIVFNNAGYSLVGTIEEATADEIRALYETNIIGPVSVIQAALPILREQGFGHILGTSSNIGHFTLPVLGYYSSSKWAFEAIHESLSEEVKQFGIKVTIIEPGAYATEFGSQESLKFSGNIEAYTDLKAEFINSLSTYEQGDPNATAQALFKVVDSENPPLRFNMGSHNLPLIKGIYAERIALWESWDEISRSAQGN
jgi:short-subunit dehydrogenase